ncbi:hypothetical protein M0802_005868 [Mischocyttarus mexicanus]|nr:hypothetical protein M0802_005868 [Mischocyttarus mexicanus]
MNESGRVFDGLEEDEWNLNGFDRLVVTKVKSQIPQATFDNVCLLTGKLSDRVLKDKRKKKSKKIREEAVEEEELRVEGRGGSRSRRKDGGFVGIFVMGLTEWQCPQDDYKLEQLIISGRTV